MPRGIADPGRESKRRNLVAHLVRDEAGGRSDQSTPAKALTKPRYIIDAATGEREY
jgi:hypothetical protein